MAIIHQATLTPSKQELLEAWLDRQPWGGRGDVELLGSYRFDDPAGEVGVEAFLVRRGELLLHLPLTYRAAALDEDVELVGTTEHSVLGTRWVYDGTRDPVAVACFRRALRGEQEQAVLEMWDGDRMLERRDSRIRLRRESESDAAARSEIPDTAEVQVIRVLGDTPRARTRLAADWGDGRAVVAVLAG